MHARIDRPAILPALSPRVIIPSGVDAELGNATAEVNAAMGLARGTWLEVATPHDQDRVRQLREDLDLGEAEAIALALER